MLALDSAADALTTGDFDFTMVALFAELDGPAVRRLPACDRTEARHYSLMPPRIGAARMFKDLVLPTLERNLEADLDLETAKRRISTPVVSREEPACGYPVDILWISQRFVANECLTAHFWKPHTLFDRPRGGGPQSRAATQRAESYRSIRFIFGRDTPPDPPVLGGDGVT